MYWKLFSKYIIYFVWCVFWRIQISSLNIKTCRTLNNKTIQKERRAIYKYIYYLQRLLRIGGLRIPASAVGSHLGGASHVARVQASSSQLTLRAPTFPLYVARVQASSSQLSLRAPTFPLYESRRTNAGGNDGQRWSLALGLGGASLGAPRNPSLKDYWIVIIILIIIPCHAIQYITITLQID